MRSKLLGGIEHFPIFQEGMSLREKRLETFSFFWLLFVDPFVVKVRCDFTRERRRTLRTPREQNKKSEIACD